MRYIITESKFKKVIFKYLDSLDFTYQKKSMNGEFFLFFENNFVFEYRYRPDEDVKTLMIKYPFAMELCSIFGLDTDELIPMLIDWVNEKFSTDLNHREWNWVL